MLCGNSKYELVRITSHLLLLDRPSWLSTLAASLFFLAIVCAHVGAVFSEFSHQTSTHN